jgi:hypothetical protein
MKKRFSGIILAGLLALILPSVSCTPTPPPTTGPAALGDTAVEPVAVVSVSGIPPKAAHGSSNIKITLKNTDIWPEKSLHAVLRKLGAQSYDLDFAVTSDRSLQPCDTASSECTIANIGSDTPYFLDITGTFQIGGTFEYVWVPPGSEYPASTSSTNTAQSMPMTVSSIPIPLSSNAIHLPIPVSPTTADPLVLRTVQIVFIAQNLKNGPAVLLIPLGTGILVNNDDDIVTANHILDLGAQYMQNIPADIKQLSIEILGCPYGRAYAVATPAITNAFSVVASDAAHDLALLKLKMPVVAIVPGGVGPVTINFADGAIGNLHVGDTPFSMTLAQNQSVAVTGYTSEKIVQTTKNGKLTSGKQTEIGQSTLTDSTSLAGPEISVSYSLTDYYRTDISTNALLSGSPVYSPGHEEILGICINSNADSGTTVIIPGQYIVDLLRNNGVR